MRPVAVTMVGFGTFADPVTVDFEGLDVFALVGPTGSGKSTVIDAICFALYGSVPRYDDRRAVGPIVHAQAAEAKVSLTFELLGRRYVAARVVRRDAKGKASTKEARLETADGEVLAGTAKEMDSVVPERLGLDFDQFTRAVVLPQGDFARFLHDKPAARQDLLVQLLGLDVYERMMQRARTISAETQASIAADRNRIEALTGATPDARAALVARRAECTAARDRWRARQPELEQLLAAAGAADADAARAGERARTLAAVEPPRGLDELAAALRNADAAVATATTELEQAGVAVTAAETARAEAGSRDELMDLRRAQERRSGLHEEVATLRERAERLAPERASATEAASAAEEHVERLRAANAAVVVREHLHAGEPCPVCEQIVERVPAAGATEDLRIAREAARDAATTAERLGREHAELEARIADRVGMLAELDERLGGTPTPAEVGEALARIETAEAVTIAARERDATARRALTAATEARSTVRARGQSARASFRTQRDVLAGAGLTAPPETDDLAADWEALVAWSAAARPEHEEAAATAAGRAAETRAQLRDALTAVAAEAVGLGLEVAGDAGLDELLTAVATEARLLDDRVDRFDADVKERERLIEASAARADESAVAGELARLLDASHFERWLVSEAIQRLVAGGSVRLVELSGGRYSFAMDPAGRDLLVVDHTQGDERRSVRTLSGGETFQASLALALALSDQLADLAADGAARLESIFLDEGFGTLDAETLETVATTIENLAAGDRMVGIVTHVPELAARIPVQFRVARHGRSSTVERVLT